MINSEWIDRFNHTVVAERVPVSGMLELTRRCNLKCVHCYLGEGEDRIGENEMSTEQVVDVIDQITEAGCLYLSLTGGDPMMRGDFPEVYRHARENGLLVTVMCDGVLVTTKIIDLFREMPPSAVEVSLYGATAATYENITRVPGSFARCVRGIRRLVDAGIKVRIKTVLMSLNSHEAEDMRQLAQDFGLELRMDAAIFPCLHTSDKGLWICGYRRKRSCRSSFPTRRRSPRGSNTSTGPHLRHPATNCTCAAPESPVFTSILLVSSTRA